MSGIGWGSASVLCVMAFQLVFMAIMARILEPSDFGLVAIATISLRFFGYFSQMGISAAIVQKAELEEGDLQAALFLSMVVSVAFCAVVVGLSPLIERYFAIESLGIVTKALSLNFLIVGLSNISTGLIRRKRAFKALSIIEILSYLLGYGCVGIGLAYSGAGYWALVAAFLFQNVTTCVIAYVYVKHPMTFDFSRSQLLHFIRFGGKYSLTGFVEFLTSNAGPILIGKIAGAASAGYYNRAMLLSNLPVQQPTKVLTQALFPILSSMHDEHDKQRTSLQLSILLVGCYAFSVGLGIYIAAEDIVLFLLGDGWLPSVNVLKVLALSVGPLYVANVIGVSLDSMGRLSTKLVIQLLVFATLLILLAWYAPSGDPLQVAACMVAVFALRLFMMLILSVFVIGLPLRDLISISLAIIVAATSVATFVGLAAISGSSMPLILRLMAEIVCGGVGLTIGSYIALTIVNRLDAIAYAKTRLPDLDRICGFLRIKKI